MGLGGREARNRDKQQEVRAKDGAGNALLSPAPLLPRNWNLRDTLVLCRAAYSSPALAFSSLAFQRGVISWSGQDWNPAGSVHPPSTSMATSSQYRQLLSDYGPPSLGYTQGTGNSQVPQSKYAELLAIIEELGKEIRPTYAGSKSAMERLKRGIIHARGLVRECLAETERNARS
ncbi:cyclin-dependent kinase 2-associated protein 1 isoform X1 [Vulpes vulpes]|uniref:Cyclin-dependent kinase 2-associated protein 1 isoform X1 n=1 Tax=Vulpes vulpes TaxID=9627 RepID=A0A3Q7UI78_VULVU|nr:cyclin-dependent kinase 2-associated protein 1 isoform X2 [Vulpes vulpes]